MNYLYVPPASMGLAKVFADLPQPIPSWTDKEVLFAVGSMIAAALPVCLFVIRLAISGARRSAREAIRERDYLKKRVQELERKVDALLSTEHPQRSEIEDMGKELRQAREQVDDLRTTIAVRERERTEQLSQTLDSLQGKLQQYQDELAVQRRRVERALNKDGQTWMEKVLSNACDFRPLEPDGRRTPILSILNLKGGVGKTTTTANLGAALDGLGYRVLLLDLDLQGSLTGLFLPPSIQEGMYEQEKMLADFLAASFGAEYPNLLNYTAPILSQGRSRLVPTTDGLAYAETNLTIRWVLREGNRDPRFLLRRELQLKRIINQYDIILLDCPPLMNVCCVNALVASDYVLIPVLPSRQATDRVPVLLQRLKQLQENMNANLSVLGILANRTHRSELTADEENRLSLLRVQCKDLWGQEVPQFDTFIRQSPEVRTAEDEQRPLCQTDSMYQTFLELAREVESRLPTFCRPVDRSERSLKEAVS